MATRSNQRLESGVTLKTDGRVPLNTVFDTDIVRDKVLISWGDGQAFRRTVEAMNDGQPNDKVT